MSEFSMFVQRHIASLWRPGGPRQRGHGHHARTAALIRWTSYGSRAETH